MARGMGIWGRYRCPFMADTYRSAAGQSLVAGGIERDKNQRSHAHSVRKHTQNGEIGMIWTCPPLSPLRIMTQNADDNDHVPWRVGKRIVRHIVWHAEEGNALHTIGLVAT